MLQEELKLSTKGSISLGLIGEAMLTGIIAGYLVYFGSDILGLSSVVMGNLLLISQVLGGIMDLAFGVLIENTQTKAGKARSWILRMCIPFALSCILIFLHTRRLELADQLPSLLAIPFAAKLCGRYGKRNCTMAGCLLSTVFRVIMLYRLVLLEMMAKKGIRVLTNAKVQEITENVTYENAEGSV